MKLPATLSCVSAFLLAGCSSLPTAGPTAGAVIDQAEKDGAHRFDVVNVDKNVIDILAARPVETLHSRFGDAGLPPAPRVSIGDSVTVSIWEAGGGSLFNRPVTGGGENWGIASTMSSSIPPQVVSRDGAISVPFAGRIKVAGRSILEIQDDIQGRLNAKASQPQVIVSVPSSSFNAVTVSGEVVNGARVPLAVNGSRLLDLIAAAGGAKAPVYNTFVRLSRGGVTASVPLETLIADPSENIYAWPGDVVTLVAAPRSFDTFGAIGRNGEIAFEAEKLWLSQALAKASGLLDDRADPAGVFLMRFEPADLVAQLKHAPSAGDSGAMLPVVYHFDFSDADSFFLARKFQVADKDMVYIADARLNGLQKFFGLIGTLTSPIVTGVVVQNATK